MKKIALVLMLLLAFTLSGCKKVEYNLTVDSKGKAVFEQIEALNFKDLENAKNTLGQDIIDKTQKEIDIAIENLQKSAIRTEKYTNGDFYGIKITSKYGDLDKVVFPNGFGQNQGPMIKAQKSYFKSSYAINMKFDPNQKKEKDRNEKALKDAHKLYDLRAKKEEPVIDDNIEYTEEMQDATGMTIVTTYYKDGTYSVEKIKKEEDNFSNIENNISMVFKLKLPKKVKQANSTSYDKKTNTHIWNLDTNNPTIIQVQYEYINWGNIFQIIAIVIVLILTYQVVTKVPKGAGQEEYE